MALLGVFLGIKGVIFTLWMATIWGAIFGISGILLGKLRRTSRIPFSPFIAFGAFSSVFIDFNIDFLTDFYIGIISLY